MAYLTEAKKHRNWNDKSVKLIKNLLNNFIFSYDNFYLKVYCISSVKISESHPSEKRYEII